MLPPLKQQGVANKLEPWGELQSRVLEHLLQSVRGNIRRVLDFVQVGLKINIGFNEEDIIDW